MDIYSPMMTDHRADSGEISERIYNLLNKQAAAQDSTLEKVIEHLLINAYVYALFPQAPEFQKGHNFLSVAQFLPLTFSQMPRHNLSSCYPADIFAAY